MYVSAEKVNGLIPDEWRLQALPVSIGLSTHLAHREEPVFFLRASDCRGTGGGSGDRHMEKICYFHPRKVAEL